MVGNNRFDIQGGQVIVDRGARRCVLTGRRRCRSLGSPVSRAPGKPGLPSDHFTTLLVHPGPDGTPRLWAGTFDQGVVYRDSNDPVTGVSTALQSTGHIHNAYP